MLVSHQHNVEKITKLKIGQYGKATVLGTTLTNKNCMRKEVQSGLKLVNACYHWAQNFCLPVYYLRRKD